MTNLTWTTNRQAPSPPDVVAGAGPTGLAYAFGFRSAGLRVELLEASDGAGGRPARTPGR